MRNAAILVLIFVAVAFRVSSVAQEKRAGPDLLMKADMDFDRATAEKGIEGWVSYFAEDGTQVTPDGNIKGHAAIREYMGPAFARPGFSLRWKPTFADISGSGDLGYTTGTYESRGKNAQGQEVVRTGRYVTIWKKQAGGNWKVAVDIGNPDAPPQKPN